MKNEEWHAYLGALFAVVVWGASFIATKIALRQTDPFTVICLRFGIGIPVLFAAVARRGEFTWPGWRAVLQFVAIGTLGITVHQWLQVTGLVTAQASTTASIITATPLTIALVGWAALGERLRWQQWAGIALGTAGVLLVVSRGDWGAMAGGAFGSFGDLLVSLSTITWALFSVYSRKALQRHAAAPMMLYVMAGGWAMTTVPWVLAGGSASWHNSHHPGGRRSCSSASSAPGWPTSSGTTRCASCRRRRSEASSTSNRSSPWVSPPRCSANRYGSARSPAALVILLGIRTAVMR